MAVNHAQLKVELETDPLGLGYAPYIAAGQMQALADILNQPRASIATQRAFIRPEEVFVCWSLPELEAGYAAADGPSKLRYSLFLMEKSQNPTDNSTIYQYVSAIFISAVGPSVTAMNNLASRNGSRSEELFGVGTVVWWWDCHTALYGSGATI